MSKYTYGSAHHVFNTDSWCRTYTMTIDRKLAAEAACMWRPGAGPVAYRRIYNVKELDGAQLRDVVDFLNGEVVDFGCEHDIIVARPVQLFGLVVGEKEGR